MRIEDNTVILERKDCMWCDENGTQAKRKYKTCPKCNGTGLRGRGRCRECNDRNGYYPEGRHPGRVMFYDHDDREPCRYCGGQHTNVNAEGYTDYVDAREFFTGKVEVIRSGREQSWSEQYLGVRNGVYTVVDYGAHKTQPDEALIERVLKELEHVQACKVVRSKEDLTLADGIAIITAQTGFSAIPTWR